MRAQPGTTSLRALVYMDEVFGFLPPVAEPPSKRPFLTLLKQARAYGVGLLVATQNPVDLDYKALSNAGTWFIGRMQTERDKLRVLGGLEGASNEAGKPLQKSEIEKTIGSLGKRVFLLHNVHDEGPVTFHTRWAMSYLRGPLTRTQVRELMAGEPAMAAAASAAPAPSTPATTSPSTSGTSAAPSAAATFAAGVPPAAGPPAVGAAVRQYFLPVLRGPGVAPGQVAGAPGELGYRAGALGLARVSFVDRKRGTDQSESVALLAMPDTVGSVTWEGADDLGLDSAALESSPTREARYGPLPARFNDERDLKRASRELADHLYRTRRLKVLHCPSLDEYSSPGASASEFALQLRQEAREARDEETDKIVERHEKRLRRLEDRLRSAELALMKKTETGWRIGCGVPSWPS
jgi:hypothetical protein